MSLLEGDLSHLSLPRDLELVRDEARSALEAGEPVAALYAALAAAEPVALLDLVMGPRALGGPAAVRAALPVAETLEASSSAAALYRRLTQLAPELAQELVDHAAGRHPAAGWLVALSSPVDGGQAQLEAASHHPAFAAVCEAYARAGQTESLIAQARLGRPQVIASLLVAGHDQAAILAAAGALAADPSCPVVPWIAAARGPAAEPVLLRLIPRLRSQQAARNLERQLAPFPTTRKLLATVAAGMRASE
jgi:hypothetical protein